MAGAPPSLHKGPPNLTTAEVRQGTEPRAMFWVWIGSLSLAVIAGLTLGLAWTRRDSTAAFVFVVFGEKGFSHLIFPSLMVSKGIRV